MRGIINIVIGGVMLVGGLSGNLVMRGTSSGGALAALGGVLIAVGVYRLFQGRGGGGGSASGPQS